MKRNFSGGLIITYFFVLAAVLSAQTMSTANNAANSSKTPAVDVGVTAPATGSKLGQLDVTAVNEITAHRNVIGTAAWTGMTATGSITFDGDNNSYPANLAVWGDKAFRLDIQKPEGTTSIRIVGKGGQIQDGNKHVTTLSLATASAGIVQFELPRMQSFPNKAGSLVDHGMVTVDGSSLKKISFEVPLFVVKDPVKAARIPTTTTDFYFDPNSHLLAKTATTVVPNGPGGSSLRVVSYGEYRNVEGSFIPFLITESQDGQKQWTLQLDNVQLNPKQTISSFQF